MKFLHNLFLVAIFTTIAIPALYGGDSNTTHYYFAYGSNLSYPFLKERLKNGKWISNWEKDGELEGLTPIDLGCYSLNDYEFGYTLNVVPFGDTGTAGNIVPKKDNTVYGVLYKVSEAQLAILDEGEDVPVAYSRIAVKVDKVATAILGSASSPSDTDDNDQIEAWAYVGNSDYVVQEINPDPEYVNFVYHGALEHQLPSEYVERYILKARTKVLQ